MRRLTREAALTVGSMPGVCGVSSGVPRDQDVTLQTIRIDFAPGATQEQRDAAQAALAAHVPGTIDPDAEVVKEAPQYRRDHPDNQPGGAGALQAFAASAAQVTDAHAREALACLYDALVRGGHDEDPHPIRGA